MTLRVNRADGADGIAEKAKRQLHLKTSWGSLGHYPA
jgi:hypothetical protein